MSCRLPVRCLAVLFLYGILLSGCADNSNTAQQNIIFQSKENNHQQEWQPEKVAPNYVTLARDLVKQRHYDVALGQLQMALDDGIRTAEVYYMRGVCLRETNHPQKALTAFRKSLDCDGGYARAFNGNGLVYVKLGKSDKAIAAFEQAVRIDPARADFINNLGYAYLIENSYEKAEQYFVRTLSVDAEYTTARNNLALCYGYLQRDGEAFKVLREKSPPDVAYHNMGVIYGLIGKKEKAAAAEQKALMLQKKAREKVIPEDAYETSLLQPMPLAY